MHLKAVWEFGSVKGRGSLGDSSLNRMELLIQFYPICWSLRIRQQRPMCAENPCFSLQQRSPDSNGVFQWFHWLHHCSLGLGEKSFTQRLCWLFGGCPWRLWRRVRRELPLRLQSSGRCKHVEGTWKESCAEMAEMRWVLLVPNSQV